MTIGIDISEHNGNIDLRSVSPEFVIIRCGYGTHQDKLWKQNVKKCEELLIPYGIYWYSYALTVDGAVNEAKAVNECLKECKPVLGIWFDMEDGDYYKKKNSFDFGKIPQLVNAFRSHVDFDSSQVGVYTSKSWLKYLGAYDGPLWVAEWGTNDGTVQRDYSGTHNVYMLQFTSKYKGRNLDGDVLYMRFDKGKLKDLAYMVIDTLDGMYGNGDERKKRLGSYYNDVQEIINTYVGKGYSL